MYEETIEAEVSDDSLDKQIDEILDSSDDEVQNQNSETPPEDDGAGKEKELENKQDKTEYPAEFLNEDGSLNTENLLKSYRELKPLAEQKAEWEKEKAELQQQAEYAKQIKLQAQAQAQNLGYQNSEEYELVLEVAQAQANEYLKYLHLVGEPDKVRGLLALYANSPSPELLEQIEDEFSVDVVKNVSIHSERVKNQIIQRKEAERYEVIKQEAETFVNNAVKDYPDWFKIPEFTNFFADALRVKGDRFIASEFVKHIENLKEVFRKEFLAELKANKENENELNSIKNLAPKNMQQIPAKKNYEDYSPEELDKAIEEFI